MKAHAFEPVELDYCPPEHSGRPGRMNQIIAGIDEAGRGCLAGPVSLGLVVLPYESYHSNSDIPGLNDSKQLSERLRNSLWSRVIEAALYCSTVHINSDTIDRLGINPAIRAGIDRLIRRIKRLNKRLSLSSKPVLLIDGNYKFQSEYADLHSIIKGDQRVKSIAAASILAKVSRDRKMIRYARSFPQYGFEKHKGYGTALHRESILKFGTCHLHRKSYSLS